MPKQELFEAMIGCFACNQCLVAEGESQRLKSSADFARIMLATSIEHYPYFHSDPAAQPLEVHRSKISLHRAKAGYDYPTIRLPHTFSKLAGLSTQIYQTIYDGS